MNSRLKISLAVILITLGVWIVLMSRPTKEVHSGKQAIADASAGSRAGPESIDSNDDQKTPDTTSQAPMIPAGQNLLAMANDTTIPADEREIHIMNEGKKGVSAIEELMALGDSNSYFSYAAVKALANANTPEVLGYLKGKLEHPDPRVVCAAAESLAGLQTADAVPSIAGALVRNRRREDGFEDLVCSTCVDVLGQIGSPDALPALAEELTASVGGSLGYDYGTRVVKAMGRIGDAAAVPMLLTYIQKLDAEKQANSDNAKALRYFQSRIDETRSVIESLENLSF